MQLKTSLSEKFGLRFIILATVPVFLAAVFSVYIYNDAVDVSQQDSKITIGRKTIADIKISALTLESLLKDIELCECFNDINNLRRHRTQRGEQESRLLGLLEEYKNHHSLPLSVNKNYLGDSAAALIRSEQIALRNLEQSIGGYSAIIDSGTTKTLTGQLEKIVNDGEELLLILRRTSDAVRDNFESNIFLFYPIFAGIWLLVVLGGSAFMSFSYKKVIEPIKTIAMSSGDVLDGRRIPTPSKPYDGEIDYLFNSLNKMSSVLLDDIKRLEAANVSKTEFISVASHQLRTPLSSMKWLIESLRKNDANLTAPQKEYLVGLYESNERLISLVGDLLNVSRLESGAAKAQLQLGDIVELMRSTLSLLEPIAKSRRVNVDFEIMATIKPVLINQVLFNEAFENLLDNAITYSPEGKSVLVKINQQNDNYVISIRNDGPIIAENEHDKIFTKFYRGPKAQELKPRGSGLGLFVAKLAVEANGGKIWYESPAEPGSNSGAIFYLSLPIHQ